MGYLCITVFEISEYKNGNFICNRVTTDRCDNIYNKYKDLKYYNDNLYIDISEND